VYAGHTGRQYERSDRQTERCSVPAHRSKIRWSNSQVLANDEKRCYGLAKAAKCEELSHAHVDDEEELTSIQLGFCRCLGYGWRRCGVTLLNARFMVDGLYGFVRSAAIDRRYLARIE
jgi:hypothetical protein